MNKTAIKNFAVWARKQLISEITYKARFIGVSENGILDPLGTSSNTLQFFDIGTGTPTEVSGTDISKRNLLVEYIKEKEANSDYITAFNQTIEEVAYTWFNRLIAIRFMEVNDYLPSRVRVLSSEISGKNEPDIVTDPHSTDIDFSNSEIDFITECKDENNLNDLFRMLFIKQCNKLNEVLPNLFEKTNHYTELLLSISFTDDDGIIRHLVNDIDEQDFTEAVEIIGWLYQYYNTEPKAEVFAGLKKNVKITKEKIPAATQLFTPDWIVRYMVENSLGRIAVDKFGVDPVSMDWKYYLAEAEQTEEVQSQLKIINSEKTTLEELKVIDPCMGSGHILVYAFDVLMQIYENQGYTSRDAVASIVQNNLYGLDIDERAYQLAYFAIMMKARNQDRRFFTREIAPQVYCPKGYEDGEEYGSLLNVDELEEMSQEQSELSLFNEDYEQSLNTWNFRRLLSQKYDVVVTNPPYMGASGMNTTKAKNLPYSISDYVKKYYPDSKSDMFACFIERGNEMTKSNGYNCMVTMQSWMFLSSFEKMRNKLIQTKAITNLMHMDNMVMGIAFGTAVAVFKNINIKGFKGTYNHITMKDIGDNDEPITFPVMTNRFAQVSTENFSKIPGSPIAYWISKAFINAFENGIRLEKLAEIVTGISTGDNGSYLRTWTEINYEAIAIYKDSVNEIDFSLQKWIPYNKGGEARKWYGNNDFVVKWSESTKFHRPRPTFSHLYLKEGITWSFVTSGMFSARYYPNGFLWDVAGSPCVPHSKDIMLYTLAFLSTRIANAILKMINPTINCQVDDIQRTPMLLDESKLSDVVELAAQSIDLSKNDWNGFEASWDFARHPIAPSAKLKYEQEVSQFASSRMEKFGRMEWHYENWEQECLERFTTLKSNEEELNRIFIDIYGLQDELTPEVADKDVTVRLADKTRDIKSFISYAVGCMFGRYSLDVDGLAYAGGEFQLGISNEKLVTDNSSLLTTNSSLYKTFMPDMDNCIPITDEKYFADDIVTRFTDFVKVVYGADTLEQNLDFIANALGNKGDNSRDVIRKYFLKDFYKDHVKTYQKRPIYWLYDSGKQDGFKALIYMHRYNPDTTGLVRVNYLHELQKIYEIEINNMKDNIENAHEVAKSQKRLEKLTKQLKEAKDFDEKIAHLALSRIAIDLDDGVKVNYEKVQAGSDGKKLDVLGKI